MSGGSPNEVTQLLLACRTDPQAIERLMSLVYEELRRRAHQYMRVERPDHTLQTTALVHEAYLKLVNMEVDWRDRAHFFAVAARAMRQILLDHAKARQRAKRGGDRRRVPLHEIEAALRTDGGAAEAGSEALLALDAALQRLDREYPRQSRIVECRFFGGMPIADTAAALGISPATVKRGWAMAQAWLYRELARDAEGGA